MSWTDTLGPLSAASQRDLMQLRMMALPKGTILFRPGDRPDGFLVVLSGRVEVFLTGPSGREILLYAVGPGQSCVQTTLGLMGGEDYSGEAIVAAEARAVTIPAALFARLMDHEPGFRAFILRAFGRRMADVTRLLERVAFGRVEARLAAALLDLARDDVVAATQAELAARIGSAREVVSRRLEGFQRQGWVETDRGQVRLTDPGALRGLAAVPL
ncbi:Crp/Fnr family transcriptional regulator [Rhodobacter sp. Har01]|uniref:Crp/Fnr family transcriptional regulator n=1 Tax=Rhodobacter sp. Har01 TaxID=2883999 RepID=UPI001D060DAA|nr:Crp/Fnr family transcriptional regulator [Rhodobacter sp. Har01]MCB6177226.1 Crp/Fnr family transcriptional regulator [Rhodobacter sp. Har01]